MEDKFDYFKKLIALNDLELFFDQVLEELKFYKVKKSSNELNELGNQIIILSQNYYKLKKDIRLSLISAEEYRRHNNKIVMGLLAIIDELSVNSSFKNYVLNDQNLQEKYSYKEEKVQLGLRIIEGDELGRIYPISRILREIEAIKIGRLDAFNQNNNYINIMGNDSFMSRKHATIVKEIGNVLIIKDGQEIWNGSKAIWQRSLNGLDVNFKEVGIEGVALDIGHEIMMGDTILRVIEL